MSYYGKRKYRLRKRHTGKKGKHWRNRRMRYSRPAKPINFAPLGTTQTCRLRYCQNITIDAGAGLTGDYVFSANGAYDPDISGVGHQPYGFDQMMAMFDHCTVVGSKITVQSAYTVLTPLYFGICLRDNSTTLANNTLDVLMEQSGTKFKLMNYGSSAKPLYLTKTYSMKKYFRGSKFGDNQFNNSVGSNPTEQAYYHVIVVPNGTTDPDAQRVMVTIDYICVFSEPKTLSQS